MRRATHARTKTEAPAAPSTMRRASHARTKPTIPPSAIAICAPSSYCSPRSSISPLPETSSMRKSAVKPTIAARPLSRSAYATMPNFDSPLYGYRAASSYTGSRMPSSRIASSGKRSFGLGPRPPPRLRHLADHRKRALAVAAAASAAAAAATAKRVGDVGQVGHLEALVLHRRRRRALQPHHARRPQRRLHEQAGQREERRGEGHAS